MKNIAVIKVQGKKLSRLNTVKIEDFKVVSCQLLMLEVATLLIVYVCVTTGTLSLPMCEDGLRISCYVIRGYVLSPSLYCFTIGL